MATRAATTAEIALYRKATGCPIARAAQLLNDMDDELRSRVLRAAKAQHGILHDPIEDEPSLSVAFSESEAEANQILERSGRAGKIGSVHLFWTERSRILRERFGVRWYSPREMNPDVAFD